MSIFLTVLMVSSLLYWSPSAYAADGDGDGLGTGSPQNWCPNMDNVFPQCLPPNSCWVINSDDLEFQREIVNEIT